MYVNGYYSEWFPIRSGVAQGCPLSPLLFLVVAEAMKIAIDMEKGIKGINIRGHRYKLSQFADDTTVLLGSKREIKLANAAIQRWCRATGMRENVKKREGLAMGKYRAQDLKREIKWAKEKGWCISLGVPIGNELDESKWWSEKINSVRKKTLPWLQLKHNKYFGRNLIVQGCYFGRLRYWLYSIYMEPKMCEVVQRDADVLWWSRYPTLEIGVDASGKAKKMDKRVRRWMDRRSAVGPTAKGGLNLMEWRKHAEAYYALWPVRYLEPGEAAWKRLLDSLILYDKKGERLNYPEGRSIILQNLSTREKANMISKLPKKATYIKACFRQFWKLKLVPKTDTTAGIGTESPWHGHRVHISVTNQQRHYCKHVLQITQFSDCMDRDTNRPFSRFEWKRIVKRMHRKYYGVNPTGVEIFDWAEIAYSILIKLRQKSRGYGVELLKRYTAEPKKGLRVYLVSDTSTLPAIITNDDPVKPEARLISIDAVGKEHLQSATFPCSRFKIIEARMWNGRWAGPAGATYACDVTWDYYGISKLSDLTIHSITKRRAAQEMLTPAAQERWNEKLQAQIKWPEVWQQKPMYASARDRTQIMRLQRRNLWVAQHGGCDHTTCAATGCNAPESQLHLVECPILRARFWSPLAGIMTNMGLEAEDTSVFWITGELRTGKQTDKESWAIVTWALRSLYAQIVHTHLEGGTLDIQAALFHTFRYAVSRTKAHGRKWKMWYRRQVYHSKPRGTFPLEHARHTLVDVDVLTGDYHINKKLYEAMEKSKP